MALYLVQYTMSGEPVGIHNQFGEDYYPPTLMNRRRVTGDFSEGSVTWEEFVERQTETFNQRIIWGSVTDSRTDIEDILDDLRNAYTSA